MAQPRSPREVFCALVNAVAGGRTDELPGLYAARTDVVHPFDPLRAPALRTRDEIRDHFRSRGRSGQAEAGPPERRRAANITIHETTDPEVIIAEFEYQGTAAGTGEQFTLPAIFVLRVRDGEIVSSRDYFDHVASARARGQLGELVAAISAQTAAPAPAGQAT
jgi:ketosteroid isomerase-like protein